jgi:hypothetical protein
MMAIGVEPSTMLGSSSSTGSVEVFSSRPLAGWLTGVFSDYFAHKMENQRRYAERKENRIVKFGSRGRLGNMERAGSGRKERMWVRNISFEECPDDEDGILADIEFEVLIKIKNSEVILI